MPGPAATPLAGGSAGFEAQLARAETEDRELAGRLASEGLRPLLVGAVLTPQRQLAAQILRPARGTPYAEDFSFRIWNGETEVCSLTASVTEWTAAQNPPGDRSNARVRAWLEGTASQPRSTWARRPCPSASARRSSCSRACSSSWRERILSPRD